MSLRPLEPPDDRCVPTSNAALCVAGVPCPRSAWVAAWVTTWAWVRQYSCWPWKPFSDTRIPDASPTLLLCPMSLVGNWQREAAKFAPGLRGCAHGGDARLHGGAPLRELLEQTDLIVSTYATATRDIDELAGYEWKPVVLFFFFFFFFRRGRPRRSDSCRRGAGWR